jgi:cytochrome P450
LESLVTLSMLRLFVGLTPGSAEAEDAASQLAVIGDEVRGRRGTRRFRAADSAAQQIVSIIRRQESAVLTAVASGREPPPSFLATLLREYPNALDDPTISANLAFLIRTTTTDVTGLLHWIVKMLGDNNECLVALRRSPDSSGMAERVVMETLRLHQSEYIARDVRQDIELGEFVVPAGWKLRVCVHESHRDPAVFADPDRFDPDRFETRFNRHQYSPFGTHGHTCLGTETTRMLAGAFVQQLAHGYELVVASDGPLDWRYHWRPGSRHRIILRPLCAEALV